MHHGKNMWWRRPVHLLVAKELREEEANVPLSPLRGTLNDLTPFH
jgi:hypothetical protein